MRTRFLLIAVGLCAGAAPVDPDWPCQQRLVPTLTATTLWSGPAATTDWRTDPALATLVDHVADRRTDVDAADQALQGFVNSGASPERRAAVFAGLVAQSNVERDIAVARLHDVSRRLRSLADAAGRAATELNALPADSPQRAELTTRRELVIREYDSLNRTVRYSCEIPVDFEARLGRFGKILAP
ncbi:MAG: hypothetical protein ACRYG8_33115 [Janthinobacterium lividum]